MSDTRRAGMIDAVIKIGGALVREPGALDAAARAIVTAARSHRLLIVPGGGPFADAVRAIDRDSGLTADAAHWMAILGMEQYAHLLVGRMNGARLVACGEEIRAALDAAALPVLAPYRWLRAADPLPHSWDVTSDSIAAWVAGAVGARTLVLIKPVAGSVASLVDAYFARAVPAQLRVIAVVATDVGDLESLL